MVTVAFVMVVTFLCLRRGVSYRFAGRQETITFSLPTQRCFPWQSLSEGSPSLFSAYAEVFPAPTTLMSAWPPFLCLRRGVSHPLGHGSGVSFFSLPTQRCFPDEGYAYDPCRLFSAYAEVFPIHRSTLPGRLPFLCLRRGVSIRGFMPGTFNGFSLPTQRCFPPERRRSDDEKLFSAYAEVFPPTQA